MKPSDVQRKAPQRADNARGKSNKYVMPGLVPVIAHEFLRHKAAPHARTIAMNRGVEAGAVPAALFRDLYDRLLVMDQRLNRVEGLTVRELMVVAGRRAA